MNVPRAVWTGGLALILGAWASNWWGLGPAPPWRDLLRDPVPTDRAPCYMRYELSQLPERALLVWLDLAAAPAGEPLDDDGRTLQFMSPPVRLHVTDRAGRTVKHSPMATDPHGTGPVVMPLGTIQARAADTYVLTLEILRPIRHWTATRPRLRIQTGYTLAEMERSAFVNEVCQPIACALAMALAGIGLTSLFYRTPSPSVLPCAGASRQPPAPPEPDAQSAAGPSGPAPADSVLPQTT